MYYDVRVMLNELIGEIRMRLTAAQFTQEIAIRGLDIARPASVRFLQDASERVGELRAELEALLGARDGSDDIMEDRIPTHERLLSATPIKRGR